MVQQQRHVLHHNFVLKSLTEMPASLDVCSPSILRAEVKKQSEKGATIMAGKNTAAFGIFRTTAEVDRAVEALRHAGFRNEDISVLFPENEGTKQFAHEKHTKAPEGAATGAGTGAVLGGGVGLLAALGSLTIPGIGPFLAAGPIVAALAGAGAGGAIGGIAGALIGMGIPEYEAKRYEGQVKQGGILLSVHCDNSEWTSKAKKILEVAGAHDVASAGEAKADFNKSDRPFPKAG
jgi:hypothetical protein